MGQVWVQGEHADAVPLSHQFAGNVKVAPPRWSLKAHDDKEYYGHKLRIER
jgi:hypothetical protein